MGKKDKDVGEFQLSRRDFLKVAGAGAAAVAIAEPLMPAVAAALTVDPLDITGGVPQLTTSYSTCPYCSAQCGQRVVVGNNTGKVYDIYGDFESPTNNGGLCAKGAGSLQLVNNPRRIGAWKSTELTGGVHPTGHAAFVAQLPATVFPASSTIPTWATAGFEAYDGATYTYADGVAYFRRGNDDWASVPLPAAMTAAAAALKTARGEFTATSAGPVLTAPATVDAVSYLGFSNLGVVGRADLKFFVGTGGVKVNAATLGPILAALPDPAAITALQNAIDDLVWIAEKPKDYSTWTFAGRSDLKSVVFAAGHIPDSIDIVRDTAKPSQYYAYVATTDGQTLRLASTDFLVWTDLTHLGAPGNTSGMVNPAVIRSGDTLKVWHNRFSAPGVYDYSLYYSAFDGTAWTAAVPVTHNGSQLAGAGHPYVIYNGSTYTLYFNQGSSGIYVGEAPFFTPQAFKAATLVYNGANTETNVVALPNDLLFTEYVAGSPVAGLEWAYSSIVAYKAQTHNSKAVAFFGSSHMNNESNYIYRKIIANFGTSNVEHQARI